VYERVVLAEIRRREVWPAQTTFPPSCQQRSKISTTHVRRVWDERQAHQPYRFAVNLYSNKSINVWRRRLKSIGGRGRNRVTIFRQVAENFRQRRLRLLKISVLLLILSKMCLSALNFAFLNENFCTRSKIFCEFYDSPKFKVPSLPPATTPLKLILCFAKCLTILAGRHLACYAACCYSYRSNVRPSVRLSHTEFWLKWRKL